MAIATKTTRQPEIQLIANAVVTDGRGRVLLTRYDDEDRWWLPGTDLTPYEHPDEAVQRALHTVLAGSTRCRLHHVESFRGRRGWHVMFNHRVTATAKSATGPSQWFAADALPRLAHGRWEREVIAKVLAR
jgi:ADP-ribose pyrophosphatase YjhB (NUDIX family)